MCQNCTNFNDALACSGSLRLYLEMQERRQLIEAHKQLIEAREQLVAAKATMAALRTSGQKLINAVRRPSAKKVDKAIKDLAHLLATNPGIGWASPDEVDRLRKVIEVGDRVLGGRKSFAEIDEYKEIREDSKWTRVI